MSGDESFLARWSRRKRAAAANGRDQARPVSAGDDAVVPDPAAASMAPGEAPPPIDPASLPPIESLGPGSDLRAFLAAGVPADLARAALRRAWSTDPTIRDFIGLSENSWDFNAPGGVPGFGVVTAEDVRRLLAQATGEPEAADPACGVASTPSAGQTNMPASESGPPVQVDTREELKQDQPGSANQIDPMHRGKPSNVAAQYNSQEREYSPILSRRHHGSALPE